MIHISYHEKDETVTVACLSSGDSFAGDLETAKHVRAHFRRSKLGSDWGCDGIGYQMQKTTGNIRVHRSGVGPRKYAQGLANAKACGCAPEI